MQAACSMPPEEMFSPSPTKATLLLDSKKKYALRCLSVFQLTLFVFRSTFQISAPHSTILPVPLSTSPGCPHRRIRFFTLNPYKYRANHKELNQREGLMPQPIPGICCLCPWGSPGVCVSRLEHRLQI